MPLRLPPLPALRLFEAAGRLRSFKLAAAELNVTPSAVSHGIVGLEQQLGVTLFERRPRGLSLTQVGADYLTYVGEALSLAACGGQGEAEQVVRGWIDRLNHDLDEEAAAFFAPGATVEQRGETTTLTTHAEIVRWNASLPCQGRIVALGVEGERVTATFLLDHRHTFACPAPLSVDTAVLTVRDGRIVAFQQLED